MRFNLHIVLLQAAVIVLVSVAAGALHRSLVPDLPTVELLPEHPEVAAGRPPAGAARPDASVTDPVAAEETGEGHAEGTVIGIIGPARAFELFESGEAQFVDARNPPDFDEGHIPSAINLPFSAFGAGYPEQLDYLGTDLITVVYCEGGECESSKLVAQQLLMAFPELELKIIGEGYPGWVDAGHPTEGEGTP